ncbi:MAG: Na/Pi cotransporter family protein [Oscillospiraceae bacterium]|nr:Na/Pi cotransporter family protein [Oscillospiraceae bacterium]
MTTYFFNIVALLGGLALFLFGMDTMGKALERQAGGKLQTILAKMSSNVFKGFALGMAVTAVIQSSSATTVMVVGFVNSGIMTLKQAVGVIMGSNIGTTVTAWILSLSGLEGDSFIISFFKPSTLAPLVGIVGAALFMFSKSDKKKGIGIIALGFLALMTGMDIMGDAMAFLKNEPWFAQLMISFSNPILGIIFGALLTALIQSSSASVGILQSLCSTGAVTFGAAIPIILGQNIGTCITAIMGAIGANRNARRTALVHLLFNVVGVALFSVVFYGLGLFIDWAFLTETAKAWDIAVIHTLFNVAATAVLMPLNSLLVKLAYLFIPAEPVHQSPVLLDERLLATPAVAVQQAHGVAVKMGRDAVDAMHYALKLVNEYDTKHFDRVIALEDETDRLEDALGTYLVKLSSANLSVEDNRSLNTLLYSIADIERIGDHAKDMAMAAQEIHEKNIAFSQQGREELSMLWRAVEDVMERTIRAYAAFDRAEAAKVEPLQQVVSKLVREIKSRHVRRLRDGLCTVEYGFVLEDILTACERTADHCSNVAVEILQVAQGKLESHQYLHALKSGKLDESAAFSERLHRYEENYHFPDDEDLK